jgi:hypothetical protein
MFHSDGNSRVEKSENDKNDEENIKRQDSLDRFLRNLRPIKAPRDESLKSKNLDSLMPRKVGSSQEYWDPVEEGLWGRQQWERTWDAEMERRRKILEERLQKAWQEKQYDSPE